MYQFNVYRIGPEIKLGSVDISFTNASLFMVISSLAILIIFNLGAKKKTLIPDKLQLLSELSYSFVAKMISDTAGSKAKPYFSFIFSLFMFVLFCNMFGMIPYAFTVTSHIIVTFVLAAFIFVGVTIIGFMKHGLGYLKLFVPSGVPMVLLPLIVVIEIISYLSRPISLSVRLFANMMAGHTMLKVFGGFVISLGDIVPEQRLRKTTEFGTDYDPHFWHDVNLFATAIELAGQEFSTKFPNSKNYIDSATVSYTKSLYSIESYVRSEMAKIPDSLRVLITAHDAFGYYGKAFDIEVKGVQGISTASDISIRGITELTDFIVSRNIPSIFVENSVSEKNINSVVEGCKSKGLTLKIGGPLFSDGLGDAQSGAETYINMIKNFHNYQQYPLKNKLHDMDQSFFYFHHHRLGIPYFPIQQ
mgnify:CR=1 FL=1